ncbi:MAG: hypothetical protein IT480_16490 [Gammaproteobacteria bacterium]|nr:hypothetical protein [Gammaproteobacteria bacterium]
MRRRLVWPGVVGLGLLAAVASAQVPSTAHDAAAGWHAVMQCAELGSAERRHACLDDVLRRAGLLSPAEHEAAGNPRLHSVPAAVPTPPAPEYPDQLRTTVRSARVAGNRKLLVVTADAGVWEQTGSEDFHVLPQSGDAFTIQRGTLGSYRCSFGRSSIYRCHRLE